MVVENYNFNILHEVVASSDLFAGKTHEKVANNLFELIESSERGVTIGLEGGWGSGKSTVVNLLRAKLADHGEDTLFFVFDAWAHDGDPLRRIFLESLINEINSDEADSELAKLKQEISGRRKSVEVTTTKATSKLGGWLSFSAIFVPLGAAILSAINYETLTFSATGKLSWALIFGFIMVLSPLWALVLWFFWGEKDGDKRSWDVFASSTKEKHTQDITEDGERTSVEFEDYFKKIMDRSIGEGKKYSRALIVVDNLDRIEPDQTLAIWSILQTFFQHRNSTPLGRENEWSSKLWFLVPFDREGLSRVWRQRDRSATASSSDSSAGEPGVLPKNTSEDLAPSFLEKCFQIIAEVPEPVMSAWVEFLDDAIKKSLVGWPRERQNEIIDTFKRFESRLESSPTPRQIQVFANRVGMLGMRWRDEMSAEAIALYALARKDRSDRHLRKILLEDALPDGYEGTLEAFELKMQLAGMLFGVDKKLGIQLLLRPEIHAALKAGDAASLKKLLDTHGEAFWVVWQSIRDSLLPTNGHVEEYRIAVTKAFCGGLCGNKAKVSLDINRIVDDWKSSGDKWNIVGYDYSEALASLINVVVEKGKRDDLLEWLVKTTERHITRTVNSVDTDKFKPSVLSNIFRLADLASLNGKPLRKKKYPGLDAKKWGMWLEASIAEKVNIDFVLPSEGCLASLAGTIDANNADAKYVDILIKSLPYEQNNKEWVVVADRLILFANSPTHAIGVDCVYRLMADMYLMCDESVSGKIKECVIGSQFRSRAEKEPVDTVPSLLALSASVFEEKLHEAETCQNVKIFWQSDYDKDKMLAVIGILKEQGNISVLWHLARNVENKMAIGFVRSSVEKSIYESGIGVEYIDEYVWATEEEQRKIIEKSIEYGGLAEAKESFIGNPVAYRTCLKLIKSHGGIKGEAFVEEVVRHISSEQWEEALRKDIDLYECLNGKGDHEFKQAVQKILFEELGTSVVSVHIWDKFSDIYSKLLDKEDVAKTIAHKYFDLDNDPFNKEVFEQFSICASSFVNSANPESIMKRVELWLDGGEFARVKWLLDTGFVYGGTPKESLESRVSRLIQEGGDENKGVIQEVASRFNINIDTIGEDGSEV